MLFSLICLLSLLEVVHALIKFAQGRDIFICDFVAVAKLCQADFYMMYSYRSSNYQHDHFQVFSNVVENSFATITHDWVIHLNNGTQTLFFHMAGHSYVAHIVIMLIRAKQFVCKAIFETSIMQMKGQCFVTANMFIIELNRHFVDFELINALGIVYL
jgi:L-rhamnose mutarotase